MSEVPDRARPRYAALDATAGSVEAKHLTKLVADVIEEHEEREKPRDRARKSSGREKLERAVSGFLYDLLRAADDERSGGQVYRARRKEDFSGKPASFRNFEAAVKALPAAGLIEHERGYPNYLDGLTDLDAPEGTPGVTIQLKGKGAHFSATPKLLRMAADCGVRPEDADDHFRAGLPEKPLVLKGPSEWEWGRKVSGASLAYRHTEKATAIEQQVKEINAFLDGFDFSGRHRGFLRIFNKVAGKPFNWDGGGRLYSVVSGSYQTRPSDERVRMTINNEPVAEVDVSGSYLTLMHGLLRTLPGGELWREHAYRFDPHSGDPYALPGLRRDVVKLWGIATLTSAKHLTKWPAEMNRKFKEERGYGLAEVHDVTSIRGPMEHKYPVLKALGELPLTWATIMFAESEAVIAAMVELKGHSAPAFPVHDSLIVRERDVDLATEALKRSYQEVAGIAPNVNVNPAPTGCA